MAKSPSPSAPVRLHLLLERVSTVFRSGLRAVATAHELKLVQLEALLYLSMANHYSDTLAALTAYLGVTKGTASQTLKALVARGLVDKTPDPDDARVQHCALTPAGAAIAAEALPAPLIRDLPGGAAEDAIRGLELLLVTLQRTGDTQLFGVCRTCRHFRPRGAGGVCGLTEEPLPAKAALRICREHSPA